ncbi:MAG: LysE family translocator [Cyanobacteria bacterium J069]|nr:MAG: LysE family translocator [Cyanobacteria bacterium J069]
MQSSMTLSNVAALFAALAALAALPSMSVLTVSTRAATFGFLHGVLTALGIVAGDVIFIAIALWGLSFLMATLGSLVFLIKYLGGAYLIAMGIRLLRAPSPTLNPPDTSATSRLSSFLAGLLITLADQKATLFYLGFFPAFLDLSRLSYGDAAVIMTVAIAAVGGVKIAYAWMAHKARILIGATVRKRIHTGAGYAMIAVGIVLIATAQVGVASPLPTALSAFC